MADDLRPLQQMAQRGSLAADSRATPVPAVIPLKLMSQDKSVAVGLERRRREEGVEQLSEEEATSLANEELHAMRRERRKAS